MLTNVAAHAHILSGLQDVTADVLLGQPDRGLNDGPQRAALAKHSATSSNRVVSL